MGLMAYLKRKNYQFELATSIYMLEPWEKMLFRIVLLLILGLLVYSFKVYEPYLSPMLSEGLRLLDTKVVIPLMRLKDEL